MPYWIIQLIHLSCAILFIGVVFFEIILLEGIRKKIGNAAMKKVEVGLIARAQFVMPWVVALLFLSGGTLASTYWHHLKHPLSSSFGFLLSLKILLALSVLGHFIFALSKAHDGCMSSKRFELTHISVAIHMILIVFLAKAMFELELWF